MRPGVPTFVAGRLVEGREARGLTTTQVADLVGISKQSVSAYENGKQVPTLPVLERIAQKLHLPTHFFVQDYREEPSNPIFFRSLAATTKRARTRAVRRLKWLEDIIEYLSRFVEFLPVNLPRFDIRDPSNLSFDAIEDIARKCRREFGLGDGPISNVVRLLENHGVIVTRQELDTRTLDAFSTYSARMDFPVTILGTDKDSAVRSRFDALHELGHLILHHSVSKLGSVHKLVEDQANRFAAAFLLPAETFAADLGAVNLTTFWMLKKKWRASIGAMIYRCEDLGILREDRARRMWINYTQKGFKKREPLDDILEIESPVFLRRCFELIVTEKVQTKEDILDAVPLAASDIEDLTGLKEGYLTRAPAKVGTLPRLRQQSEEKTKTKGPADVLIFPSKK